MINFMVQKNTLTPPPAHQSLWTITLFPILIVAFFMLARYMLGYAPSWYVGRDALCGLGISLIVLRLFHTRGLLVYLSLWLILALGYGVVGLSYGEPDANAIAALINTNPQEAGEYLSLLPDSVPRFYTALIVLSGLIFWHSRRCRWEAYRTKRWVVAGIVLIFAITGASVIRSTIKGTLGLTTFRINEVVLYKDVSRAWQAAKTMDPSKTIFNRTPSWKFHMSSDGAMCDTCVLVMGESVRRDFMGAYGAPWNNTPWMSAAQGRLWTNFHAASFATVPSLSEELYAPHGVEAPEYANNVITLASMAGYETGWISNQHRRGGDDSPVSMVASYADYIYFTEDDPTALSSDEALIEPLKTRLKADGKKRFIVVHLWGSHPTACNRTGGEYTEYFESKEMSCYIESLRRTDRLVARIEELVRTQSKGAWSLIYTADHGLGIKNTRDGWAPKHTHDVADAFEPPLIMTGTAVSRRENVTAERSGRYFSLFLAQWLGIVPEGVRAPACDWLGNSACEDQQNVKTGNGEWVPISSLPHLSLEEFREKHHTKE